MIQSAVARRKEIKIIKERLKDMSYSMRRSSTHLLEYQKKEKQEGRGWLYSKFHS